MSQIFILKARWGRNMVVVLFCLGMATPAQADSDVYDRVLNSTGLVLIPGKKGTAAGTCWLADKDRKLVITSAHVVDKAREVLIYFPSRVKGEVVAEASYYLRKVPAVKGRIVKTDRHRDLALVQLESVPEGVLACPLATHSSRPGEVIHSVGNSGLLDGELANGTLLRYTQGNVRQVYKKKVRALSSIRDVRIIETQSPVNEGDSGGPIVNKQGKLVGVTHAYNANERLVSYNIDLAEVQAFLRDALAELDKKNHVTTDGPGDEKVPFSFVGTWKVTATEKEGKPYVGEGQFDQDGTFVLAPRGRITGPKIQRGRYTYANDILWLIGDQGRISLNVTWVTQDQFNSESFSTELLFERQPSEVATP